VTDLGSDPALRAVVKAARAWGISPSRFLGAKHVVTHEYDAAGRLVRSTETPEWTVEDREFAFALVEYEAGLCPGCNQPLDETSRADHQDAYRPEEPIRCHYCTAQALISESAQEQDRAVGLMYPLRLDLDVVEQNRQPVPPLPPELQS